MSRETRDSSDREDRVNEAIAAYLEAADAGREPARDAFLAQHPEIAEELAAFLADRERFRRAAAPLDPGVDETISQAPGQGQPRAAQAPLGVVHYFGDYELLEEIARGGMGVVYRARQVSLNRVVAVKMILAGRLASATDVQRFRTEAQAAARLKHANIIGIHEVGEHEGQHYFSMDYVEGRNLAEIVRENVLPASKAAGYVRTIAEAIQYAHREGVLHRDLKPSNVLIDAHDRPHVTDFGLAKQLDDDSGMTATGQIVGTAGYMAPEQAAGRHVDVGPASDVYSLGAILYELVTGRPPFRADTFFDTIQQVRATEPVPPRLLNPKVPRDLDTICLKCLEKDPRKRYPSADELADDLGRFQAGEPTRARPASMPYLARAWFRQNVGSMVWTTLIGIVGGLGAATGMCLFCRGIAAGTTVTEGFRLVQEQFVQLDPVWVQSLHLASGPPWLVFAAGLFLLCASGSAGFWAARLVKPANPAGDVSVGMLCGLVMSLTVFVCYLGPMLLFFGVVVPSWHEVHFHRQATDQIADVDLAGKVLADVTARLPYGVWAATWSSLFLLGFGPVAARSGGEWARRGNVRLRDLLLSSDDRKPVGDPTLSLVVLAGFAFTVWAMYVPAVGLLRSLWNVWSLIGLWFSGTCILASVLLGPDAYAKGRAYGRAYPMVVSFPSFVVMAYLLLRAFLGDLDGHRLPLFVDALVYSACLGVTYLTYRKPPKQAA